MLTTTNLDFDATAKRACRMTIEELEWTITDCHEAVIMAEEMERAGCPVAKTGGYYRDEASVYRTELRRRIAKAAIA